MKNFQQKAATNTKRSEQKDEKKCQEKYGMNYERT
jgi:hypothetical protein